MKSLPAIVLLLTGFVFAQPTALMYAWKANTNYTFSCTQHDKVQTQALGMQIDEAFTTRTDFVLAIQSVDPSGLAKGKMYLINYLVKPIQERYWHNSTTCQKILLPVIFR